MANLGKSLLSCQKTVIQTGDEYTRITLTLRTSRSETARLTHAVDALATQQALLDAFKSQLFSKLLVTRSWIFLDFQQYVAAYLYFALTDISPIRLSAIKSASEYAGDAATLQEAIGIAEVQFKGQLDEGIIFRTDDPTEKNTFDPGWKDQLVKTGKFVFKVRQNDVRFVRYERVRLFRIRYVFTTFFFSLYPFHFNSSCAVMTPFASLIFK